MSKKTSATIEPKSTGTTAGVNHALAPANAALSREQRIELFRQMVRIRRFEERSLRAYQGKKIGGFLHLYIGQEAVAVGCCSWCSVFHGAHGRHRHVCALSGHAPS